MAQQEARENTLPTRQMAATLAQRVCWWASRGFSEDRILAPRASARVTARAQSMRAAADATSNTWLIAGPRVGRRGRFSSRTASQRPALTLSHCSLSSATSSGVRTRALGGQWPKG